MPDPQRPQVRSLLIHKYLHFGGALTKSIALKTCVGSLSSRCTLLSISILLIPYTLSILYPIYTSILAQETRFDEARFGMLPFMRMESALPTVMGHTFDHLTGEVITVAFDPILEFRENTIDNPIADGGGANNLNMKDWWVGLGWINPSNGRFDQPVNDGAVHCANVRRTFLNEDGCEYTFPCTMS